MLLDQIESMSTSPELILRGMFAKNPEQHGEMVDLVRHAQQLETRLTQLEEESNQT